LSFFGTLQKDELTTPTGYYPSFMKFKLPINKILITGIALLLAVIITIIAVTINASQKINNNAKWVAHTQEVLFRSEKILTLLVDNETGARGYIITGNKTFLEPLKKSQKEIYNELSLFKALTNENPGQQILIDSLTFYIDKRIAFSNSNITTRDLKGPDAAMAMVITGEGKFYTDRIRFFVDKIQTNENALLEQRKLTNELAKQSLNKTLITLTVAVLFLVIVLLLMLQLQFISIQRNKEELKRLLQIKTGELNSVFERITDAFVALDSNWCYIYMNKKAGEIFNRDPTTIIGKHIWTEFPEGIGQPFHLAYEKAMEEQQYVYLEEYYHPYDKWFENHIYPSPEGLSVFFRDITERKKAEIELREKGNFIESIINASPDIIYIYDIEERKNVFVNNGMQFILGYNDAEIKEMGNEVLPMLMTPEDFDNYLQNIYPKYASLKDKELLTHEYRMKHKDGTLRWLFTKESIFLRNPDGTPKQIFGVTVDITERKIAEEKVKEKERQLRLFVEYSPAAIAMMDKDMKYIVASKRYLKDYNLGNIEIIGKSHYELFPEIPEHWKEIHRRCLVGAVEKKDEDMFVRADGNVDWIRWEIHPWYKNQGEVGGLILFSEVITERKKTELALAENENYLRIILDTEPECVKVLNNKGELLSMNPAGLAMIEADNEQQVVGHRMTELVNEKYRMGFNRLSKEVFNGNSGTFEFEVTGLKGGHRWLETHAVPLKDAAGKIISLLGVTRDITESKKAEEEIIKSTEQLRQLTAHLQTIREEERKRIGREIHDELGQQLTAIKMDVAWIDKKTSEDETAVKGKLKNIITLLDGSNVSVRKILNELRPAALDDHGLREALEWQSRQFTESTGIPVRFTATVSDVKLREDISTCLFRVYQESLTNIMRYARAGSVTSSLHLQSENIMLTIEDDGTGFDIASLQNKKTFGILGMKERVLSMKGTFELKSSKGKGTKIVVSLPYMNV
jgi:PAS domain S-box-containing protein